MLDTKSIMTKVKSASILDYTGWGVIYRKTKKFDVESFDDLSAIEESIAKEMELWKVGTIIDVETIKRETNNGKTVEVHLIVGDNLINEEDNESGEELFDEVEG